MLQYQITDTYNDPIFGEELTVRLIMSTLTTKIKKTIDNTSNILLQFT